MSYTFDQPSFLQRFRPMWTGFDGLLALAVVLLAAAGLATMYSAGFDQGTRFVDHARNMLLAVCVLFLVAQVPPQQLMRFAVPLYFVGLALLIATALPGLGVTKKGATPLALDRRHDPAERDHEDRDAVDARVVVPATRRPAACARLPDRDDPGPGTGRLHRQAARPGHRDPGAVGRALRDLLRRPVVEADRPGGPPGGRGDHGGHRVRRPHLPA